MRKLVPNEDLVKIAGTLEDYHKVFYTFWNMTSVMFTDELPTAAVQFVKNAPPILLLNEAFWGALSPITKQFVIVHECLHVILDHFKRNGKHIKGATPRLVNVAQDITINEMAVDLFGFDREDIDNWKKFCWIETCFKQPHLVKRNQSFLYYLALLIAETEPDGSSKSDGQGLMDEHGSEEGGEGGSGGDGEPGDEEDNEERERAAGKLAAEMDEADLVSVLGAGGNDEPELNGAGVGTGCFDFVLEKHKPPVVNFKTIIENLKRTRLKKHTKVVETFRKEHRRFQTVATPTNGLVLPGRMEIDKPLRQKLFVAVFMDVSGSCLSQLPKFYSIIEAFREEKDLFDCEFYLFDTGVQNITDPKKAYTVGGGTRFDIIETELQTNFKAKYGCYPDAVIVISDGDGNKVEPQHPNRWVWLLTDQNVKTFIHISSKTLRVRNVVFTK